MLPVRQPPCIAGLSEAWMGGMRCVRKAPVYVAVAQVQATEGRAYGRA